MATSQDIIAAARALIGTPYHHQARLPGVGMDCAGPVMWVGQKLGLLPADLPQNYGRHPTGELEQLLDRHLMRISTAIPGCVIGIKWFAATHHVGIVGGYLGALTMIHSLPSMHGVREHGLRGKWCDQVTGLWAYRGVML